MRRARAIPEILVCSEIQRRLNLGRIRQVDCNTIHWRKNYFETVCKRPARRYIAYDGCRFSKGVRSVGIGFEAEDPESGRILQMRV